jgi:predicted negative regulator of RcsB-dependent stress response
VAQHISRKDLKKDEFRESLAHGAEAVRSHQKLATTVLVVAAVVVVAILGWRYYTQRQTTQASAALDDAMRIYETPVTTPGQPPNPDTTLPTYTDEKSKWSDAAKKFDAVASNFGRTRPGIEARYYEATCYEHLGQYDVADRDLTMVENSGDSDLAALAKYQHAGLYVLENKSQQAIALYNELLKNNSSVLVPKPLLMISLADLYKTSNPAEATKLLNQVKSEFPNSPAADEADKRLSQPTSSPQS